MKNKGLILAITIYLILLIADMATTLSLGELTQYLEANPLYKYGGIPLIVGLNIVFIGIFWLFYTKSNTTLRFVWLNCITTISVIRIIIIRNNYLIYLNPPTLEAAQQVTEAVKQAALTKFVWLNMIPAFIGLITYGFFMIDHKIERK